MAARSGDPFSDVDLLLIHYGPDLAINFEALPDRPVLAAVHLPRPHPAGIGLSALCVSAGPAITWLNIFHWPAATAQVPVDSLILYDTPALPYSPLRFEQILDRIGPGSVCAATAGGALAQIAADAKQLARDPIRRAKAPPRRGDLAITAEQLRRRLAAVDPTCVRSAIDRTAVFIDLAEAARTSRWCDGGLAWPPQHRPLGRCPPMARPVPARQQSL